MSSGCECRNVGFESGAYACVGLGCVCGVYSPTGMDVGDWSGAYVRVGLGCVRGVYSPTLGYGGAR